ncbi:MAG TPA: glucosamine-6-phosphate deaminase [Clostridia bacterium]|nr:glucosamine-6-phosphate deaminase [Clostridia bacterium]
MKLICVANEKEMSVEASRLIASLVRIKPNAVLGLPTGSTPMGTYSELIRMFIEENLDFSDVRVVNLDEYIGLSGYHPQSYRMFMREQLFDHINIPSENTFIPDGMTDNIDRECREYDELLEALGFADLQLLGLGPNGHIAFNEPGDQFIAQTHCATLTESTIEANQRFFDRRDQMPTRAITMGMRGIMSAKRLVLIACGRSKADAIAKACFGPVTPQMPASIVQLHRDATVIVDEEALSATGLFGNDDS